MGHSTTPAGDDGGGSDALDRRTFLKGTAAAAGTGLAATALSGGASAAEFPRVSTRDHFRIDGSWWSEDEVELTDGHSRYDYDTVGSIPGLDGGSPDEVVVWVHGWRNDASEAVDAFREGQRGLNANGYDAPVVGFSYDADQGYTDWWPAVEIAKRNGYKLAAFLGDYVSASSADVRIVAHSLGGQVTVSTLKVLADAGYADAVESVSLLGAAVKNEAVAAGATYGPGLATAARSVDNFHKTDDNVLEWAYTTAEFSSAVGEDGCDGTEPAGYTDFDVTDSVPDHFSYMTAGEGCMGRVVSQF